MSRVPRVGAWKTQMANGLVARPAPLAREFAVAVGRVGLLGLAGAEFCPNLLQRPGSRRSAERETL